jgi:hypothetical protein
VTTKNAQTTAARLARIERALEALLAQAPVPAKAAPASAKAAAPNEFVSFLRTKAAAKIACEVHDPAACNRRFSPASSGRTSHVARIEA